VIATIIYVITLATMLALVTPNFGSLSRYKTGFSTYLFVLVAAMPYGWILGNKKQIT
jgi:hypothetical protein